MEYVQVLLPSAAIGAIFWLIMHWIFTADRSERKALSAAKHDQKFKGSATENSEQKTEE